ncbi:hypothetical protein DFH28DRAFT_1079304 [Melampsora americana]|nr:hypothetical protein DFH28DRAFT_1079304 [Melampsora americana]
MTRIVTEIMGVSLYPVKSKSHNMLKFDNWFPEKVLSNTYYLLRDEKANTYRSNSLAADQIPDLKKGGFTWVFGRHVAGIEDFAQISDAHKAALKLNLVEFVQKLTVAQTVYAYESAFRDQTSPGSHQAVSVIHFNMSLDGSKYMKHIEQKVILRFTDPMEVKFKKYMKTGKDIAIMHVWRLIHIVQDNHLGLHKWNTLLKEEALEFEIKPEGNLMTPQAWSKIRPNAFAFMQHNSRVADGHETNVPNASFTLQEDCGKPPTQICFEAKVVAIINCPPIPHWRHPVKENFQH